MRCSGSPTTSTAADTDARAAAVHARTAAAHALSAIVFREILEPLAAGLGPVGEMAIGSVADTIFTRPKP